MTGPGVALPLSLLQVVCGGPGSAAPARGMWEEVVGVYSCPTPWAAKASLYSLGVRCTCRVG